MNFEAEFSGTNQPFEGERTLLLKGLPQGAKIERAAVTLTPVKPPGRDLFTEVLVFNNGQEPFGGTKTPGTGAVEVAFHARRTLASVQGTNLNNSVLLVDLGAGVFMEVNQNGALAAQGDTLFTLQSDHVLPGLTVAGFRLDEPGIGATAMDVTQITVRSVPTQVSLAINDQPPFWIHTGEMTAAQTSRDFAEFLQAYLDEEAEIVDGYYQVPLVLHSDTLARLDAIVSIDYQQQQSGLPEGVGEVALSYAVDSTPQSEAELIQLALPAGAEVTAASVQVVGAFDDSRIVVGPTGPLHPAAPVPVTAGRSQVHPIRLATATAATAIDLLLSSVSETSAINLNIREDIDGRPFEEPLLPVPVQIELTRELAAQPTWLSAQLPAEFQFLADTTYWLELQPRDGSALWHADPAPAGGLGMLETTNDGLSWHTTRLDGIDGPLAAYFRLRYTPDRYTVPLEVSVGRGDTAERVSLERFAPLKRIDFTIDFPEFVQAINRAARREEAARCPLGEQLGNPDLERWRLVDQQIGEPVPVSAQGEFTVAADPGGRWIFAGMDDESTFLSLPDHQVLGTVEFNPVTPQHVAVGPGGRRVYMVDSGNRLRLLDGENYRLVGSPWQFPDNVYSLALSPDGQRLYLGTADYESRGVYILDTAALEDQLSGTGVAQISDVMVSGPGAPPNPIPLPGNRAPVALALSPDGRSLYVALQGADIVDFSTLSHTAAAGSGGVMVYDTAQGTSPLKEPIEVGSNPADLQVTPDGRWLLAANLGSGGSGSISFIDAARLFVTRTISLPAEENDIRRPYKIAIAPDGGRAFVAMQGSLRISVLSLPDGQISDNLSLGESFGGGFDLAVAPQGDRLYAAIGFEYEMPATLYYLPLGRLHPEEWTLTTGFVRPLDYAGENHLAALLGPVSQSEREARPVRPSSLSQVIPATGGCSYTFQFWGLGSDFEAAAEVIWRGSACSLERTDRVPIHLLDSVDAGTFETPLDAESLKAEFGELFLHRAVLEAPPGARQAEIRFLVPTEKNAVIDSVSFEASADPLTNGDLRFVENDELTGWSLAPSGAAPPLLVVGEDEVQIKNSTTRSVSLFQSFPVTPAQPFELELDGRIVSQLATSAAPQVELRWLDEAGAAAQAPTVLAVSPDREQHHLAGAVPAGATQAELHLVIPAGVTLGVRRVSFSPVQMISVPIEFIAQSPGELTVEGFDVTYEVGAAAIPPEPEAGLCEATPPGHGPHGKPGGGCPWCSSTCEACKTSPAPSGPAPGAAPGAPGPIEAQPPGGIEAQPRGRMVAQPREAPALRVLAPRRRAVLDRRALAFAAARPALQPMEADIAAFQPAVEGDWARLGGNLTIESVPLEIIDGVAEDRAETLRLLDITNLPQLAEADPARLAAVRGISDRMAEDFIGQARSLLAEPEKLPAPLISCLMPTYNRRPFVAQAIAYFRRQDYPRCELIILDDGEDDINDLVPDNNAIHYLRLEGRQTIGEKLNRGAQAARGALLANWDDDVWYAPNRLSYQAAALLRREADLVGLEQLLHFDPSTNQAWHSRRPPGDRPWMPGGTTLYRKSFWSRHPYPNTQPGGDIEFLQFEPTARMVALQSITWMVDILHGSNTSPKNTRSPLWSPIPVTEIRALIGAEDFAFYQKLAERAEA